MVTLTLQGPWLLQKKRFHTCSKHVILKMNFYICGIIFSETNGACYLIFLQVLHKGINHHAIISFTRMWISIHREILLIHRNMLQIILNLISILPMISEKKILFLKQISVTNCPHFSTKFLPCHAFHNSSS